MQNLQNKYCEPLVYVAKDYVRVMTTTVKITAIMITAVNIFSYDFFEHIVENIFSRISSVRIFGTNLFSPVEGIFKIFRQ